MKEERERTPLRIILQNFINHVENLETYRSENSYDKEFQDLKLFSENLKTSGDYSCKEGEKEFNRKKNRYKDILPFDYSRVTLSKYVGVPGSDYINANYIKGASGSPAYIASQGPLPHTVNDFWRMVVECEVQVIVMACNEEESGKHKCENYWVDKEGDEKKFGMVAIRLLKASTVCPDFLVRTMQLKYVNSRSVPEERVVCQFHYGAWPDHGVPGLVRPLLEMVRLVRDTQASETLPVLVHCSAGCGRTGTICAIDYVWGLLRAGKLRLDFSLFRLVRDMRKQRIAMVQTKDQYILVHQAVRELFQDQLRMIHSHPYENIDVRGHPLLPSVSPKATIIQPRRSVSSEEKQDGREKESGMVLSTILSEQASVASMADAGDAPPLPHKKRIHTVSSKQEKEVENLTQKQLSIASASGNAKVQSSCVGETLDKGNDLAFTAVDKNLKKNIPEASAKGLDKVSEVVKLAKNPSAPEFSCLGDTLKTSVNSLPISNVHDVQHSMAPNQTETASNLQKPCIAKLKALFESNTHTNDGMPNVLRSAEGKPRLPQLVTRSHSLGAVRKPHKFTQFNAASPEISIQSQQSSDSNESGRYKSASNIHADICGSKVKDMDEMTYNIKLKTDLVNKPCSATNSVIIHSKSEPSSIANPLKLSQYVHMSGGKLALSNSFSGVLYPHEKSLDATNSFASSSSCISPGDSKPALPIKRSKSLKVQSTADHFKLSLAKRNHGMNQDMSSSEDDSSFSVAKSFESTVEISLHLKNSKECERSCHGGESSFSSSNVKKPCSCQVIPGIVRVNPTSSAEIKTSEVKESSSRPVVSNIKSEVWPGNRVLHLTTHSRINIDSKTCVKFPEQKKVNEHVPKVNRDICRARSLHVKREKSSPHISLSHSQESEYVNVKKVDSVVNARHPNETVNVITSSADDSCKGVFLSQPPNNIPIEASNIIEDCRKYLLSEGMSTANFNESQRIAAASARHKVDTVAGGLGIRERRNSFRCAVGQAVDEKNTTGTTDVGRKWVVKNAESYQGHCDEDISVKRQFEPKPTNSAVKLESMKIQKKLNDRCKVVEPNVISKNSSLVQKPTNSNESKYVTNVKSSENLGEVNIVEKVNVRLMESRPVSGDIAQRNMGVNGKKSSDSSSYQISSSPAWKQSVVTSVKKSSYIPPKPNLSSSQINDLVHNPPKGNGQSYVWSSHQPKVLPQKKGNPSINMHSVESLGAQSKHNSMVPLEVDVDQVAASMKNNLQGKLEGAKCPVSLENSNPGNSPASTHFTRALEVFHQTAASIRTKFSRPATGSGSVLVRSLESSAKVGQSPQNQPALFRPHQNGNPKREVRNTSDVGDQQKVFRKQQQYL